MPNQGFPPIVVEFPDAAGECGGWEGGQPSGRMELARRAAEIPDAELLDKDWGFLVRPQNLLTHYMTDRRSSELFAVLRAAAELRKLVDRIVVIGSPHLQAVIQVLLQACCDPFFNELSRAQRGCRPRMTFLQDSNDVDCARGLLELLQCSPPTLDASSQWGILALPESAVPAGDTSSDQLINRFTKMLRAQAGETRWRERWVLAADAPSCWMDWATAQGCTNVFPMVRMPTAINQFDEFFGPGVLVAAALLGIDVVRVLQGAAQVAGEFLDADEFSRAEPRLPAAVRYARFCHQSGYESAARPNGNSHWIVAGNEALRKFASWYQQLRSELHLSLVAAAPHFTTKIQKAVADDRRNGPARLTILEADEPRTIRWRIEEIDPSGPGGTDDTDPRSAVSSAAMHLGCRSVRFRLPYVNEPSIGQLMQSMLLAVAMEARY